MSVALVYLDKLRSCATSIKSSTNHLCVYQNAWFAMTVTAQSFVLCSGTLFFFLIYISRVIIDFKTFKSTLINYTV